MAMHLVEVKTLHGYTISELNEIINSTDSKFSRSLLSAVIMRYNGIHTNDIMKTLCRTRAAITTYIKKWNEYGIDSIIDGRGGSESSFTVEMLSDLKDVVQNKSPEAFGYNRSTWTTALLAQYIENKYDKTYSQEWIRQILISLNFSYKRGQYKPTKGDPELQASFKKNG